MQKSNAADQLFGEDVFRNMYANSKVFWRITLLENRAKQKQSMFFKKYSISILFHLQNTEYQKYVYQAST